MADTKIVEAAMKKAVELGVFPERTDSAIYVSNYAKLEAILDAAIRCCDLCHRSEADLIDNRLRVIRWDEDDFCHICEECEKESAK